MDDETPAGGNEVSKASVIIDLDFTPLKDGAESADKVLSDFAENVSSIGAKMAAQWDVNLTKIAKACNGLESILSTITTNINSVSINVNVGLGNISKNAKAANASLNTLGTTSVKTAEKAYGTIGSWDAFAGALGAAQLEAASLNEQLAGLLGTMQGVGAAGSLAGKGAAAVGKGAAKGASAAVVGPAESEAEEKMSRAEKRLENVENVAQEVQYIPGITAQQAEEKLMREHDDTDVATQGEKEKLAKTWRKLDADQRAIREHALDDVFGSYAMAALPYGAQFKADVLAHAEGLGATLTDAEKQMIRTQEIRDTLAKKSDARALKNGLTPEQIAMRQGLQEAAHSKYLETLPEGAVASNSALVREEIMAYDNAGVSTPGEAVRARRIKTILSAPTPPPKIDPPRSGFENLMEQASRGMGRISGPLNMIRHAGMGLVINGSIAAGAFFEAVKGASAFDASLQKLYAVAGETAPIDNMRESIMQLSIQTNQQPEDLVKSLYEIESAGFHGATALKILKSTAMESFGGQTPLEVTSPLIAKTLKAYNLNENDVEAVTDTYTKAITKSLAQPKDFEPAMSNVLDIGAKAGLSLTELASALALITQTTKSAATGSTYLKNALGKMLDPTPKMMKQAQAETDYFHKTGKGADLSMIAQDKVSQFIRENGLQAYLDRLSQATQGGEGSALGKIVPDLRTLQAYLSLIKPGAFKATMESVANSARATQKAFSDMRKSLEAVWQAIEARAKVFGITLAQAIRGPLETIGHDIMLALDWFNSLSPAMQSIIVKGVALAGALSLVVGALALITYAIEPISILFRAMGLALGLIAGEGEEAAAALEAAGGSVAFFGQGLLRLSGWIGLVVGAFYLLKTAWDNDWFHIQGGLKDFISMMSDISDGVKLIAASLVSDFMHITNGIKDWWQSIGPLGRSMVELTAIFVGFTTVLSDMVLGTTVIASIAAAIRALILLIPGIQAVATAIASISLAGSINPLGALTLAVVGIVGLVGGLYIAWQHVTDAQNEATESAKRYYGMVARGEASKSEAIRIVSTQSRITAEQDTNQQQIDYLNSFLKDSNALNDPLGVGRAAAKSQRDQLVSRNAALQDSYNVLNARLSVVHKDTGHTFAGRQMTAAELADSKKPSRNNPSTSGTHTLTEAQAFQKQLMAGGMDSQTAAKLAAGFYGDHGVSGPTYAAAPGEFQGIPKKAGGRSGGRSSGRSSIPADIHPKTWDQITHQESGEGIKDDYDIAIQDIKSNEQDSINSKILQFKHDNVHLSDEEIEKNNKLIEQQEHLKSLSAQMSVAKQYYSKANDAAYTYGDLGKQVSYKIGADSNLLNMLDKIKNPTESQHRKKADLLNDMKSHLALMSHYKDAFLKANATLSSTATALSTIKSEMRSAADDAIRLQDSINSTDFESMSKGLADHARVQEYLSQHNAISLDQGKSSVMDDINKLYQVSGGANSHVPIDSIDSAQQALVNLVASGNKAAEAMQGLVDVWQRLDDIAKSSSRDLQDNISKLRKAAEKSSGSLRTVDDKDYESDAALSLRDNKRAFDRGQETHEDYAKFLVSEMQPELSANPGLTMQQVADLPQTTQTFKDYYAALMDMSDQWAKKVDDDNKRVESEWKSMAEGISSSFSDALMSIVEHSKDASNAVRDLLKSYGEQAFKHLVDAAIAPGIEKVAKGIGHITHQGPKPSPAIDENTKALNKVYQAIEDWINKLTGSPGGSRSGAAWYGGSGTMSVAGGSFGPTAAATTGIMQGLSDNASVAKSASSVGSALSSLAVKGKGAAAAVSDTSNALSGIGSAASGDTAGTVSALSKLLGSGGGSFGAAIGAAAPYVAAAVAVGGLLSSLTEHPNFHQITTKAGTQSYAPGLSKDIAGMTDSGYSGAAGMREIAQSFAQSQRLMAQSTSHTVVVHPGAITVNGIHPGNTQQVADALVDHISTSLGNMTSIENARYGRN